MQTQPAHFFTPTHFFQPVSVLQHRRSCSGWPVKYLTLQLAG